MKNKKTILMYFGISLFLAVNSWAALITQCSSQGTNGAIHGSNNIHSKYPIASVSKIFTSLWAIEKWGATYRYPTQIYLTKLTGPANEDHYDVHLRGSVFPYFDRTMFYFLISELNKRGVTVIENLTYDENFEYASIVRDNKSLAHQNENQSETEIANELNLDIKNLDSLYKLFRSSVRDSVKLKLPDTVHLAVNTIQPLSMKVFDKDKTTSSFILQSSELHRILKEMNRNSNNFAANKIFERLSRTESFSDYLSKSIGADANEFHFVNGSGYPEVQNDVKIYNSATCITVINVTKKLFKVAAAQKFGLRYFLPIAGLDSEADSDSTVTNLYLNEMTLGSLVAKTGTISNSISLAGAVLTQDDLVYFHISATSADRLQIKKFIESLIVKNGGKETIDNYMPVAFLPFDEKSILENLESEKSH